MRTEYPKREDLIRDRYKKDPYGTKFIGPFQITGSTHGTDSR